MDDLLRTDNSPFRQREWDRQIESSMEAKLSPINQFELLEFDNPPRDIVRMLVVTEIQIRASELEHDLIGHSRL